MMPKATKRVVIHAGDYCFAKAGTQIHTLLGSCVSITLWHPDYKIGGMCHFALPQRFNRENNKLNPRFADDCFELFRQSAARHRTNMGDYHAKIFGGGNMYQKFEHSPIAEVQRQPIGEKNVAAAFNLLNDVGIEIKIAHVGEFGYRRVIFDVATGDVWVKFQSLNTIGNQRSLSGLT